MSRILLPGLDGANPLGFFAALGVLEALSDQGVAATLSWVDEGVWHPVVDGLAHDELSRVVDLLERDRIACGMEPALRLEYEGRRDLKPPPAVYRVYLKELVLAAHPERRRGVDWGLAFATDVAVDNNGRTKPTALHFTAGQQQFLGMVRALIQGLTREDLIEALTGPWTHSRQLPVMGWDATLSRDYALRASDPSTDKKLGVPGADWLAVRGLLCLPTAPVGTRIITTGCVGGWKTGRFRWGLWATPLARDAVRSLLRLDLEDMPAPERVARGVAVVFSCGIRRSDQGGYGSFEPASVV